MFFNEPKYSYYRFDQNRNNYKILLTISNGSIWCSKNHQNFLVISKSTIQDKQMKLEVESYFRKTFLRPTKFKYYSHKVCEKVTTVGQIEHLFYLKITWHTAFHVWIIVVMKPKKIWIIMFYRFFCSPNWMFFSYYQKLIELDSK